MDLTNAIRVVLMDDHVLMRAGVRELLESRPQLKVVGEAENNADALRTVAQHQPDIILLDGADANGIDLVPDLLTTTELVRLIVLSESDQHELHVAAMQQGVHGVFLKNQRPLLLIKAIESVYEGESWYSRAMLSRMLMEARQPSPQPTREEMNIATLTEREREVITLLGQGLKNREIGEQLHISESTVRHHFTSIYSKLAVSDRLELLIYAYKHDLLNQPH
ncbi:MAG: response regulator transcription factor [Chloroflexota bacterium]|nr:response regulator transcription factor [Chloroflexota bacterium]